MASAQVKKQEHLEAGKKKLEEFRKKKAAEKAKKASSASQINISDGGSDDKQSSEPGKAQPPNSITGSTPESVGASFRGSSTGLFNHDIKEVKSSKNSNYSFSFVTRAKDPDSASNTNIDSLVPLRSLSENKELKDDDGLQSTQQILLNSSQPEQKSIDGAAESAPTVLLSDASIAPRIPDLISDNPSLQSTSDEMYCTFLNHDDGLLKDSSGIQSSGSHPLYMNGFPDNSVNVSLDRSHYGDRFATSIASSLNEDFRHSGQRNSNYFPANGHRMKALESKNIVADREEVKSSGSSLISGASSLAMWSPDINYNGFNSSSDAQWASTRRSRPSFLDSINFSKGFSSSTLPEPVNNERVNSKKFPDDSLGSSLLPNATPFTVASFNGVDLRKNSAEKNIEDRQDLYSRKQNDDFAALEQHIEDLTQEKFSLQRALEASRTFADSLAAENSALTNSYNQQGSLVHQLKSELENLQQEIKAKLNEVEAIKMEYSNVQLECNAADERAKLLASEVIGLEEKALRLKSNELKLQRQLESTETEISSLKKRMSSLEKERRDMQSTIDALQEEKKLLQSMLRKSSTNEKLVNESKAQTIKRDVATTTDDLGYSSDADMSLNMSIGAGNDASNQQEDNTQFSLQEMSTTIPADQMRMIENINSLISELAMEKEELVQALSAESSKNHNLKELNKELNRKLEVQTQRLELLTSKSMVSDVSPARTSSSVSSPLVHEDPAYADEGDEVVERVLGWIMKLFPGGPSRRRNSKVL